MADRDRANPNLDKEQTEGERDTVREATANEERGGRQEKTGATPAPEVPGHRQQGVTNRPLEEEQREQNELPPRGEAKKPTPGGHA